MVRPPEPEIFADYRHASPFTITFVARVTGDPRAVGPTVRELVVMILLAQLWLFTVTLDAMETRGASPQTAIAALICSFMGCAAIWALIRFFLRAESNQ